jgi:hypothetical protein
MNEKAITVNGYYLLAKTINHNHFLRKIQNDIVSTITPYYIRCHFIYIYIYIYMVNDFLKC